VCVSCPTVRLYHAYHCEYQREKWEERKKEKKWRDRRGREEQEVFPQHLMSSVRPPIVQCPQCRAVQGSGVERCVVCCGIVRYVAAM
jgi:hypothetical protein